MIRFAGLLSILLAGCAAPQPDWLSQPVPAHCTETLTKRCLQDFAVERLSRGKGEGSAMLELALSSTGGPVGNGSDEYVAAGSALRAALAGSHEQLLSLHDGRAKAEAVSAYLWISNHRIQVTTRESLFEALHRIDADLYYSTRAVTVPTHIGLGDFDRAAAIIGSIEFTNDHLWDMAGLVEAFQAGSALGYRTQLIGLKGDSHDGQKLRELGRLVGRGNYPSLGWFYDFRSDSARATAYQTVLAYACAKGDAALASRAIGDGVRFIGKSSLRLNREPYLANLLLFSSCAPATK